MTGFTTRDPGTPDFWDERFERGFTPWDRGGVPEQLRRFVQSAPRPLRTLIPGCGSAYELVFLSDAGWDATAIDFSPAAVAAAKAQAGAWRQRIAQADFFAFAPPWPVELVYERAFLCALPPATWPRVAARWAQLLAPGGLVAGYFFLAQKPKGPPFGIGRRELDELLAPYFECLEDEPAADSVEVFQGCERWMTWRRR
jgi:SAM-dependent methyltransferase